MLTNFVDAVRAEKEQRDVTLRELARCFDMSTSQLSRILNHKRSAWNRDFIRAAVHWQPKLADALKDDLLK